jgi:hypothetical protein
LGRLLRLYEAHKTTAAFLLVQVRGASHTPPPNLLDAWKREGLEKATAANRRDRLRVAAEVMDIPFPCLLDTEDRDVERLYDAWPERLVVVTPDGRIGLDAGRGLGKEAKLGWDDSSVERCLREWGGGRRSLP